MESPTNALPYFPIASKGLATANVLTQPVPEGKLSMVITYLEMTKPPSRILRSKRSEHLSIIRANPPTISFYRFLYNSVGSDWLWYERNGMPDEQLAAVIERPETEIYVLYFQGTPAGFVEFDHAAAEETEIAYFGLIPEFIGRGLGLYFLRWAVETAWIKEIDRLWVHTCNFDHPNAIAIYQRAGFSPYAQEVKIIDDPRLAE